MSTKWLGRIGEGLVVGVTGSIAFMVFSSMNDARVELTQTRETMEVQLEVNEQLLAKTDSLEAEVLDLKRYVSRLSRDRMPTVGSAPSDDEPTQESDPDAELASDISLLMERQMAEPTLPPVPTGAIQQSLDKQRTLLGPVQ